MLIIARYRKKKVPYAYDINGTDPSRQYSNQQNALLKCPRIGLVGFGVNAFNDDLIFKNFK